MAYGETMAGTGRNRQKVGRSEGMGAHGTNRLIELLCCLWCLNLATRPRYPRYATHPPYGAKTVIVAASAGEGVGEAVGEAVENKAVLPNLILRS